MALFPVKRFLGEEEDDDEAVGLGKDSNGRAQLILQRLNEGAPVRGVGHLQAVPQTPKSQAARGPPAPRPQKKLKAAAVSVAPASLGQTGEPTSERSERPTEVKAGRPIAGKKIASSSFTVLADVGKKGERVKVERVLPDWLARPRVVSRRIRDCSVPTADLPWLHPRLYAKMAANGIHSLFPVQAQVIPAVLEGAAGGFILGRGGQRPSDILVSAPTGSGKTLAFVIPIVQLLMQRVVCRVRALVVLPTKELAQQVWREFRCYGDSEGLRVALVCGAQRFAEEQETLVEMTEEGPISRADVVVATSGRLVDHVTRTPGFSLQHLRFLVVDEADRMMDSLSQDWLSQVTRAAGSHDPATPSVLCGRAAPGITTQPCGTWPPRAPLQKLLFSATLTHSPETLQTLGLFRPLLFSAGGGPDGDAGGGVGGPPVLVGELHKEGVFSFPDSLTEYFVPVSLKLKPLAVLHFALHLKFRKILCFTNTRQAAHRLYHLVRLHGGVEVAEFSSMMSAATRTKTLKRFQRGELQLLVSSDAAARGIDARSVSCVLSYDCPDFIHTYVHRVGRTARAGSVGLAYTLLLSAQVPGFVRMRGEAGTGSLYKQTLDPGRLRQFLPRLRVALTELKQLLKEEAEKKRTL